MDSMGQREVLERVLKTVGLRLVEGTADQAVEVCCEDTGWKELRKWFCILDGRVGAENEPVGFCSKGGGRMGSAWLNLLFGGESHFASLDGAIDALKKADSIVFCPLWAKLAGLDAAKEAVEVQKNIFCGCASLEEMLVKADLVDCGQGWQGQKHLEWLR